MSVGMVIRIGKVTNIYPSTGRIKVMYEDEGNASMPLPMLTMNREYAMPAVGDRVVTVHMENGSSKGFVLGTYWGGMKPKANAGYRKEFGEDAYAACIRGAYQLFAEKVCISGRASVIIGAAEASGEEEAGPGTCLTVTEDSAQMKAAKGIVLEADEITLKCPYGEIGVEELMRRIERIEDQIGLPHTVQGGDAPWER